MYQKLNIYNFFCIKQIPMFHSYVFRLDFCDHSESKGHFIRIKNFDLIILNNSKGIDSTL